MRHQSHRCRREDSAVSIVMGYVINMGVATVVISVFLLYLQGPMTDVVESTQESELEVIAEQISNDIQTAERAATTSGGAQGRMEVSSPRVERGYTVRVGGGQVNVTSNRRRVTADYNVSSVDVEGAEFSSSESPILRYNSTDVVFE